MRTPEIRVQRWKWGGPKSTWVVEGLRNSLGKRVRRFFPSRDAANEWLKNRRPELRDHGRAAMTLSDSQRVDAASALEKLAPLNVSLNVAADEYLARAKQLSRTVPFWTLREEYLAAKKADGKTKLYISDIRFRLVAFGRVFDDRFVSTVETREIDDWLRNLGLSLASRKNFRKVLHAAFQYAVVRGYLPENPVTKTAKVKTMPSTPGILTPTDIKALLACADAAMLPGIAIAAFGGLRDAEIGRMTWDRIDFVSGYLKIDAMMAKTSSRRLVPISDNLRAWLTPFAKKTGKVRESLRAPYELIRGVRKAACKRLSELGESSANLEKWPHNALRHSYVSYRLALVANAAQVAEECGHSIQIMKQHYRELVTKDEAVKWFAVMP